MLLDICTSPTCCYCYFMVKT